MSDQDKTRIIHAEDLSKTVIRPRPGFRPGQAQHPAGSDLPPAPVPPPITEQVARIEEPGAIDAHSWNRLVEAASPLFFLATQVRNTTSHPDVMGLRERFVTDLSRFDQVSRRSGESAELLADTRYALCTFVDEAVLNTPWGSDSKWQEESLLSTFFNETWGGDRFFRILDEAKQQPARNIALLEVLFVCLVLGFEGKYHVLERGRARLEEVQDDLFRILRAQRGELERELSPHWRGVDSGANRISSYLPLWVLAAIATALLMSIYLAFRFALSGASYPVFDALSRIGRDRLQQNPVELVTVIESVAEPQEPLPPPVSKLRLTDLLQPEIDLNLLSVNQDGLKSLIRIHTDTLFSSGSATVAPRFFTILERIARALDQVEGKIWVIGHSDNVPIHTIQFPSNWELSRARAVNVMTEMSKYIRNPTRLTPEGRADTEPLVPNDTASNRALNRRVDVILFEQEEL